MYLYNALQDGIKSSQSIIPEFCLLIQWRLQDSFLAAVCSLKGLLPLGTLQGLQQRTQYRYVTVVLNPMMLMLSDLN